MEAKRLPSPLSAYREIPIRRPQYPQILKWIDMEFKVVYLNLESDADANIIALLDDDDEEEGEEEWT